MCHSLAIVPNVLPLFYQVLGWCMKTKRRAAYEPPNVAAACSSRAQGKGADAMETRSRCLFETAPVPVRAGSLPGSFPPHCSS